MSNGVTSEEDRRVQKALLEKAEKTYSFGNGYVTPVTYDVDGQEQKGVYLQAGENIFAVGTVKDGKLDIMLLQNKNAFTALHQNQQDPIRTMDAMLGYSKQLLAVKDNAEVRVKSVDSNPMIAETIRTVEAYKLVA